jgi:hypothetical protein
MIIMNAATFAEAQMHRAAKINAGHGALILDADHPGELPHLIEKLIAGAKFRGEPVDKIAWKPGATVICVGAGGKALLAKIEKLLPGFTAHKQ